MNECVTIKTLLCDSKKTEGRLAVSCVVVSIVTWREIKQSASVNRRYTNRPLVLSPFVS